MIAWCGCVWVCMGMLWCTIGRRGAPGTQEESGWLFSVWNYLGVVFILSSSRCV